jgi:hypothetical protein
METSRRTAVIEYLSIFALVLVIGIGLRAWLDPDFFGQHSSAVGCPDCPAATPTAVVLRPAPAADGRQFARIDQLLQQAMLASFAFSAPQTMRLGETVTLQLLVSPVAKPGQLATQVAGAGSTVTSGSLSVTPRMKAQLIAQDAGALQVRSLDDSPEQLIGATGTTHWHWWVTAREEGQQHLTLIVYRLVQYNGQDYWREVRTYQADIVIAVTLAQRVRSLDWGWYGGVFVTALLIPGFWRWMDGRRKRRRAARRRA